jgi:hypothetical protein
MGSDVVRERTLRLLAGTRCNRPKPSIHRTNSTDPCLSPRHTRRPGIARSNFAQPHGQAMQPMSCHGTSTAWSAVRRTGI